MPRKLYFSVEGVHVRREMKKLQEPTRPTTPLPSIRPLHTHVQCDCDNIERHCGIRDTAERCGLWWEEKEVDYPSTIQK
jgi:hypothetical protein